MPGTRRYTVQIAAPPERVFAMIGDFPRHAEWVGNEWSVEEISGGQTGVGSKYRSTGMIYKKPNTMEVEVTEYDPPRRLGFVATDRTGRYRTDYVITPQDGGTFVERGLTITTSPIRRFMGVLFSRVIKKDSMQSLNRLKEQLEGGAA